MKSILTYVIAVIALVVGLAVGRGSVHPTLNTCVQIDQAASASATPMSIPFRLHISYSKIGTVVLTLESNSKRYAQGWTALFGLDTRLPPEAFDERWHH